MLSHAKQARNQVDHYKNEHNSTPPLSFPLQTKTSPPASSILSSSPTPLSIAVSPVKSLITASTISTTKLPLGSSASGHLTISTIAGK